MHCRHHRQHCAFGIRMSYTLFCPHCRPREPRLSASTLSLLFTHFPCLPVGSKSAVFHRGTIPLLSSFTSFPIFPRKNFEVSAVTSPGLLSDLVSCGHSPPPATGSHCTSALATCARSSRPGHTLSPPHMGILPFLAHPQPLAPSGRLFQPCLKQ